MGTIWANASLWAQSESPLLASFASRRHGWRPSGPRRDRSLGARQAKTALFIQNVASSELARDAQLAPGAGHVVGGDAPR